MSLIAKTMPSVFAKGGRMPDLEKLAAIVDEAAINAKAIPQFTNTMPELTIEDGYDIQTRSLARRYQRGERRIGIKLGLTSRAKMLQVGVDEVCWGRLTDAMILDDGGYLSMAKYIHPRIEPEIAFLIKTRLVGKVTEQEAFDAVEAIAPAMEIIDSRFDNFKFAVQDVIADNASSSGLVIGPWQSTKIDISNLEMVMTADDQIKQSGSSAAILGHPIRSLVKGAEMVARVGEALNPGDIVMAGGATAAHAIIRGETIRLNVQKLGSVSISAGG